MSISPIDWYRGIDLEYNGDYYCPSDHLYLTEECLSVIGEKPELLWRVSRACHWLRSHVQLQQDLESLEKQPQQVSDLDLLDFGKPFNYQSESSKRIRQLDDAMLKYSKRCVDFDEDNLQGLKYNAIAAWSHLAYTIKEEMKGKFTKMKIVKDGLDNVIEYLPDDFDTRFCRGLWLYKVSRNSGATNYLFPFRASSIPKVIIDDAISDFIVCHRVKPEDRATNVMLARCFSRKKTSSDRLIAKEYLERAISGEWNEKSYPVGMNVMKHLDLLTQELIK